MTQPAPATLDYGTPPTRSRRWFYVVDLLIVSVLTGGWSFLLLSPVQRFRDIFSDFKTALPLPTELLLDFSDAYYHYYLWLGGIALTFIAPLPIAWARGRYQCDRTGPTVVVFILAEIASVVGILGISYAVIDYALMLEFFKFFNSIYRGT